MPDADKGKIAQDRDNIRAECGEEGTIAEHRGDDHAQAMKHPPPAPLVVKQPVEQTGDGPGLLFGHELQHAAAQRYQCVVPKVVSVASEYAFEQQMNLQRLQILVRGE